MQISTQDCSALHFRCLPSQFFLFTCTILLVVELDTLKTSLIYKQSKLMGFQICIGLVVISDSDLAEAEGLIPAVFLGWYLYLGQHILSSELWLII